MAGEVKLIVAAVARPTKRSATKLQAVEPRRSVDRRSWTPGCHVAKSRRPKRGPKSASTKRRCPALRTHRSCASGKSWPRYLAVTFRSEKSTAAPPM
jgi:hypothetical protein